MRNSVLRSRRQWDLIHTHTCHLIWICDSIYNVPSVPLAIALIDFVIFRRERERESVGETFSCHSAVDNNTPAIERTKEIKINFHTERKSWMSNGNQLFPCRCQHKSQSGRAVENRKLRSKRAHWHVALYCSSHTNWMLGAVPIECDVVCCCVVCRTITIRVYSVLDPSTIDNFPPRRWLLAAL